MTNMTTILRIPQTQVLILSLYMYTIVAGRNDIPKADFPDHVKQMHQNKDRKLEMEYTVSCCCILYAMLIS